MPAVSFFHAACVRKRVPEDASAAVLQCRVGTRTLDGEVEEVVAVALRQMCRVRLNRSGTTSRVRGGHGVQGRVWVMRGPGC